MAIGLMLSPGLSRPGFTEPPGGEGPVKLRSSGNVEVGMEDGRRTVEFTDSVVFDYGDYRLNAGRLTVDEASGKAWAEGGVTVTGPTGFARARKVWLELATARIILEDLEARLGPWTATAREADILGEEMNLRDAVLTPCPTPYPVYSLHAATLSRESPFRYVARGVVPHFYFVPFFYLPRYTYELEREEASGALVPSKQGVEFNPGRGDYSGLFLKTTLRKRMFDRKLLSIFHADYYSRPGPAFAEELQFTSPKTEHHTYFFFTRARNVKRDGGYAKLPGFDDRRRIWQVWSRKLPFGHFKSFVNDASDSNIENDYRLNLGESHLRDREISSELVVTRSMHTFKLTGENLKTLNARGNNHQLERRILPSIQWLTNPLPIVRPSIDPAVRGNRLYGLFGAQGAYGRDAVNRPDGVIAGGHMGGIFSVPVAGRLTSALELSAENEYHAKKYSAEDARNTPKTRSRLSLHHPWLNGSLHTEVGYSHVKLWENESILPPNGEVEHQVYTAIRSNHAHWHSSLDAGLDLRDGKSGLSNLRMQTRYTAKVLQELSAITQYDPVRNRLQSVYSKIGISLGQRFSGGLGFQSVHTDSESQVQITPSATYESPGGRYRASMAGYFDVKLDKWRTIELKLSREFRCIETVFKFSKRESDLQFNLSFRLSGFKSPPETFQRANVNPSPAGPGEAAR